MTDRFHNPYHFVPVKNTVGGKGWQPCDVFFRSQEENNLVYWSHKHYAKDTYQGRIVCRLTTETPIFIGSTRISEGTEDAPAKVTPFQLDDKPAIPASSLRGLISAIAEAASNSAMRILEDRALSYRAAVPGLSALGMVFVNIDDQGKKSYCLQPLTMPTMKVKDGSSYYAFQDDCYKKMFFEDAVVPRLKVLINKNITRKVDGNPPQEIAAKTYSQSNEEYYYLHLRKDWRFESEGIPDNAKYIHNPTKKKGQGYDKLFCIGQRQIGTKCPPLPENEVSKAQREKMTRGILRILETPMETERDLPKMRKHEVFIPYPAGAEKWPTYPIPAQVVDNFHKLADERTESTKDGELPYEPYGTERNDDPDSGNKYFRLKNKDIVYFRPNSTGDGVAEIALSSIWRKGPKDSDKRENLATVYNFFKRISPEILPMNSMRECISPAEMVFGFVEERKKGVNISDSRNNEAYTYAGRVRFSHGIWLPEIQEQEAYCSAVTLKILDSPKPPSPSLYFTRKNGVPKHIAKNILNVDEHMPQGRKFYLHKWQKDAAPWESKNNRGDKESRLKQKVVITPIPAERNFWFHIDFENLNIYELGMILFALRPDKDFRPKIGMGKSLGLGSVCIEPVTLDTIIREERYGADDPFSDPRYSNSFVVNTEIWQKRPDEYTEAGTSAPMEAADYFWIIDSFKMSIAEETGNALIMLGNPNKVAYPVHTPLRLDQTKERGTDETRTYEWFTANDKLKPELRQCMRQIITDSSLPFLKRN